jgi:hypothetical protein
MRIDPSSAQSPIALTQTDAAAARAASQTAATPSSAAAANTGSFVMTDQLSQLLAAVRTAPEVRPEAIASAAAKLASGELDTPQAASETASTMLTDIAVTGT